MNTTILTEQDVCVSCGFCCDRTLFDSAALTQAERDKFSDSSFPIVEINGQPNISFPCPHFCTKCTIYEQDKPAICGQFFCELIKKMRRNELTSEQVKSTIHEIRIKRDELILRFKELTGITVTSFREALFILEDDSMDLNNTHIKTLYLQFQLFNTHLTKQFKSKEIWNTYYENINQLY